MASIDCSWEHHEGVTLVTATVVVTAEPTHVTVTNCLDGSVCPPRREGRPTPGWTDDGFAGVLDPGRHALGYAVEAPPTDPPARLDSVTPAPNAESVDERTTPAAIVRDLGDPSPPADAVPEATVDDGTDAGPDTTDEQPATTAGLPQPVTDWLDTVTRRLDSVEQSADAEFPRGDDGVPDERTLRQLARRADRLADRRGTIDQSADRSG
ncbi:DUF7857 domain-containing protein [Haloarcula halophila]|uniref:DUF7857 domain-containing protein n=1 Tax=Haloarcula TaxID=2237 RepID=UPI0023E38B48|nr:hypothetical protein [Halomicroarcula sp. DFY41]